MKNNILKKRIRVWHLLPLPYTWCKLILDLANYLKRGAKRTNKENFVIAYSAFLAVCFHDRTYIDNALRDSSDLKAKPEIYAQSCFDKGMALFDLGYKSEGLDYMEEAVELWRKMEWRYIVTPTLFMCFRMNSAKYRDKRLRILLELKKSYPDRQPIDLALAKAYIDKKMFDEAQEAITRQMEEQTESPGYLSAELFFAKGDFKAAADIYEECDLSHPFHFWRPQYDYKKALAFHYSDQPEKMHNQALKIKRRLKWDRFYRLNDLEDEGIQRETVIDEIINSDEPDRVLIDPEKASHYLRAMAFILKTYVLRYKYVIVVVLIYCLFNFLKRLGILAN